MAGVARTVVAEDDHLSVLTALAAAGPDDVLVIVTNGGQRAILGELVATEAVRRASRASSSTGSSATCRGSASWACRCSHVAPTRPPDPWSDGRTRSTVRCGGVDVSPGDIVFGDDDGIVIAPRERVAAAVESAEARTRLELGVLAGIRRGVPLRDLTNYDAHVAALAAGQESKMEFLPDPADG